MAKLQYSETPEVSQPYRAGYLASVQAYLDTARKQAENRRAAFITPERLAKDPDAYRKQFYKMLGSPLTEYEEYRKIPPVCLENTLVSNDGEVEIRRMRIEVMENFSLYGILFLPCDRQPDAPFLLSQHGGHGTPEVCSDFFGDTNYNHLTARLLARGAVVFAPQLLLWQQERFGDPFDRRLIDNTLKQFGSSITALEVFGLMRLLDYFVTQPYCNADRIGMAGLSYGGFYTMMTTAADPRIRVAYASCSFVDSAEFPQFTDWGWFDNAGTFSEAEIAGLIAPRSIYFEAATRDELFGSASSVRQFAAAKPYFAAQGVPDHIVLTLFDGTHELDHADTGMEFLFANL